MIPHIGHGGDVSDVAAILAGDALHLIVHRHFPANHVREDAHAFLRVQQAENLLKILRSP